MVKKGKYVTLPRYHAGASFFIAEQVRRINQYTKFTKIPLQIWRNVPEQRQTFLDTNLCLRAKSWYRSVYDVIAIYAENAVLQSSIWVPKLSTGRMLIMWISRKIEAKKHFLYIKPCKISYMISTPYLEIE